MTSNEEFEKICKFIEENKNNNKDHEIYINLSKFTTIRSTEDTEFILNKLKDKYDIVKSDINGKSYLDIKLKIKD